MEPAVRSVLMLLFMWKCYRWHYWCYCLQHKTSFNQRRHQKFNQHLLPHLNLQHLPWGQNSVSLKLCSLSLCFTHTLARCFLHVIVVHYLPTNSINSIFLVLRKRIHIRVQINVLKSVRGNIGECFMGGVQNL